MYMPQIYPSLCASLPLGLLSPDDLRLDLFLEDIEQLFQAHQQVDDDLPYVAAPFPHLPWMEALLGCRIINMGTSIYAEPVVEDWEVWQLPDLDTSQWLRKLLEMTKALVEWSEGRFLVGQTLMRGVADMLSALRGASNFVFDSYDNPSGLRRAAGLCASAFVQVAWAQLNLIPHSGFGYGVGNQPLWAPEQIIWLQEDAMALMSPTSYKEFILPHDRCILSQFPYSAFHLHGSGMWAVGTLIGLSELSIVELHDDSGQVGQEASFRAWKAIQTHKPLVVLRVYDGAPAFWIWLTRVMEELCPNGLLLHIVVPSVAEGLEVKHRFMEMARRSEAHVSTSPGEHGGI